MANTTFECVKKGLIFLTPASRYVYIISSKNTNPALPRPRFAAPLVTALGCHSLLFVNWVSVTPLPIAAVDETPPVTVFIRLST